MAILAPLILMVILFVYLQIKTDVETQGDFIRFLIKEVENAAFTDINDVVPFVKWLDDELSYLVPFHLPDSKIYVLAFSQSISYCGRLIDFHFQSSRWMKELCLSILIGRSRRPMLCARLHLGIAISRSSKPRLLRFLTIPASPAVQPLRRCRLCSKSKWISWFSFCKLASFFSVM